MRLKYIIFFFFFLPVKVFSQDTTEYETKIKKTILINTVHYYNSKISKRDLIQLSESYIRGDKISIYSLPYFHILGLFPLCYNTIKIKNTENKISQIGVFYDYYIDNSYDCYKLEYNFPDPSVNFYSFSLDYDYCDHCGILFPYSIYRSGTVFIESETNSLYFVSGNLNLSPINTLFDLKKAGTEAWIKMAEIRYSNYMPTNINVVNRNKYKRISFYTQYPELENIEFIVEVDKKSYAENMYFINHNQQKTCTLP